MPTGQEFQEALQNPELCLADNELRSGRPRLDGLGLPKPVTGNFAAVFTLECNGQVYAVKCFYSDIKDRFERYKAIHSFLEHSDYPWEVGFEYVPRGVLVRGEWHPIVKMEWVDAYPLDRYIELHLAEPQTLLRLATQFAACVKTLRTGGAAHSDLQHGNILVTKKGELRLIDYDGMFVPALNGRESNEVGHPNYQHPDRTKKHFGSYLDNFSSWVIYISLLALAYDSTIWPRVGGGDERLVFERQGFLGDVLSPGFLALEASGDDILRGLGSKLRSMAQLDVTRVPQLETHELNNLGSWRLMPVGGLAPSGGGSGGLPSWLVSETGVTSSQIATHQNKGGVEWIASGPTSAAKVRLPAASWLPRLSLAIPLVTLALAVGLLVLGVLAWPVAAAIFAGGGCWYFMSEWLLYRRLAIVAQKTLAQRRRKELQKVAKKANREVSLLLRKRDKARSRDQAARAGVLEEEKGVEKREQDGIQKANAGRDRALLSIQRKKRQVTNSIEGQIRAATRRWSNEYVKMALSSRTIAAANIAGIGDKTCANLSRAGIRTAADLSYGRAQAVDGIGPTRAAALDQWKRGIEQQARAAATTLPAADSDRIKQQAAAAIRELDSNERQVKETAVRNAQSARQQSINEQRALVAKLQALEVEAQRRDADAEHALVEAQKVAANEQRQLAQAETAEAVYSEVTLAAFLRVALPL